MSNRFSFHSFLFLSAGMLLCACIPPLRQSVHEAAFPVINDRLFLYPVIDSSSIDSMEGWPTDKPLQDLLRRNFRKMDNTLFAEFRRCEKYGLYELTDDSGGSNVRVSFVIGRFRLNKDTLSFPLRMTAWNPANNKDYSLTIDGRGLYRAKSAPKSPFHYLDVILADARRYFPYHKLSGVFCRPFRTRQGSP